MSSHEDLVRLRDMLDAARRALRITSVITEQTFGEDDSAAPATIRFLEIIGEAARRVSAEFREKHAEIPWAQLIGTRNLLIHAYASVDLAIVWKICQTSVPELVAALEKIVTEEDTR